MSAKANDLWETKTGRDRSFQKCYEARGSRELHRCLKQEVFKKNIMKSMLPYRTVYEGTGAWYTVRMLIYITGFQGSQVESSRRWVWLYMVYEHWRTHGFWLTVYSIKRSYITRGVADHEISVVGSHFIQFILASQRTGALQMLHIYSEYTVCVCVCVYIYIYIDR